jgi:phospholipase C
MSRFGRVKPVSGSRVKAAGFQDGHAGYSNPLNEQFLIVSLLNMLQKTAYW